MTILLVISFSEEEASWAGICKILEMEVHGELTIFDLLLHGTKVCKEACRINSLLQASGFESDAYRDMEASEVIGPAWWLASVISNTDTENKMPNCFSLYPSFVQEVKDLSTKHNSLLLAEIDELGVDSLIGWLKKNNASFAWSEVDYTYKDQHDEEVESLEFDIADEREKMKLSLERNIREYEMRIEHLKESRRQRISRIAQQSKADTYVVSIYNNETAARANSMRDDKIRRLQMQITLLDSRFQALITELKSLQKEANSRQR